jgi:phosphoglycerate dehydrogenase-like enzyme
MAGRRIIYPDADESVLPLFAGERRRRLERLGSFEIHTGFPTSTEVFAARLTGADAVFLGGTVAMADAALETAPKLEVISVCAVGAGGFVDLPAAAARGVTVCNSPGATVNTVAEYALALLFAAARHLAALDRDLRGGLWTQSRHGFELNGKKLGLIGLGPIGARFGQMAQALGMAVAAWTRRPSPERAARLGFAFKPLDDLLAESDVLSLHLALTPETQGFLGADELARAKPGVVLVNTARGALVDEAALIEGLRSGHIAAAGLDVFAEEPLPAGHPLLALDTVVLSPHVAWNTPEATAILLDTAIENLERFYEGRPINVVAGPEVR